MNKQIETYRNSRRHADPASRHHLMRVLLWMWGMIFSFAFLGVYFGHVWLGNLLLVAGVVMSIAIARRAQTRRRKLAPVPMLSSASKCVWQMDREA